MCEIDDAGARKHASALRRAAERFCQEHPEHSFLISGTCAAEGAPLMVNVFYKGDAYGGYPLPIAPTEDMESAIFAALEKWLSARITGRR